LKNFSEAGRPKLSLWHFLFDLLRKIKQMKVAGVSPRRSLPASGFVVQGSIGVPFKARLWRSPSGFAAAKPLARFNPFDSRSQSNPNQKGTPRCLFGLERSAGRL
jgi:hypothetical protein